MRNRLGPGAAFDQLRAQLPTLMETLPALAQHALQRLSRDDSSETASQNKALDELREEIRQGQQRNRRLVIGATLILCASLIYGLDGYRPAMVFNAPLLTWLLAILGLGFWLRASKSE